MTRMLIRFAILFLFTLCVGGYVLAEEWPGWRGPHGNGHSKESGVPLRWDATSILWRTALPGEGQSSPVVWGERIFLTTALEKGKKRVVLCVERKTGKILWQQQAWAGTPEKSHIMNGWASATCATDSERVYAFFGKGGLHCYSAQGKKIWSRDLGEFAGPWGTSACPVIVGDLLIQNCDSTSGSHLRAVDKLTGKDVWKTPRRDYDKGGWSTPVLVDAGSRKEIVLNGEGEVTGYDPASGKELWTCKSFSGRGEPTVCPGNGVVHVVNGISGDIYSVKLGGAGDVTKSHMLWHTPRKVRRDEPSPILVGKRLVVSDMDGITTCYDAESGKPLWKERMQGKEYTASPIAAGGLVYFLDDVGDTTVLEPGPTFKIVARNSLGVKNEVFRASLTPSGGQIFVRSQTALYCIGK